MCRCFVIIVSMCFTCVCFSQTSELDSLWKVFKSKSYVLTDAYAQSRYDTIYFDDHWKETETGQAHYYRIIHSIGSNYIVKDFYMNGTLQMEAMCNSIDTPLIEHGPAIYYNKNGKRYSKGQYLNGTPKGTWYYYDKFGIIKETHEFNMPKVSYFDSVSWVPQNQSSIFIANINYRAKLNKSTLNSGHGFGLEVGLNVGYFISQKLLLAVFGGFSTRDLLYNTQFSSGYLTDFNNGFNGASLSGNDSVVVNYIAKTMNTEKGRFHEHSVYYGLMLKLPFKYAPICKIYKGTSTFTYKTGQVLTLQPTAPKNSLGDHAYFDIPRTMNWGIEVFLYNGRTRVLDYTAFDIKKRKLRFCNNQFAISMYLEKYNTSNSSFSFFNGYHNIDVPMANFMSPEFMSRYKKEYSFGIRLSYGIF